MAQRLDYQKERKKAEKKLREIATLEKLADPLNPNEVAKVSTKGELMKHLEELDICEHGHRASSILDVTSDAEASQVKDAHKGGDFSEHKRQGIDPAHSKIAALEQELCQLRTQCKKGEENLLQLRKELKTSKEEVSEHKKRQGKMATQADKDRRTIDSLAKEIEAKSKDCTQQLEDMSQRHAKEKIDLQRGIEHMKKTVASSEGQRKQLQKCVAKQEDSSMRTKILLEEQREKAKGLQAVVETKGLVEKIERQKAKAKKMSATIDRRMQKIETQKQEVAELSDLLSPLLAQASSSEDRIKLGAKIAELCEERRRVAEAVAADFFEAGHHLQGFLHAMKEDLVCPITQELPDEPTLAADGHTYDEKAIAKWMSTSPGCDTSTNSPMTLVPLEHPFLTRNVAVKKLIDLYQKWQAQCPT
jgi:myosin heavy subunit